MSAFLYVLANELLAVLLEHLVDLVEDRVDVLGDLLVALGDVGVRVFGIILWAASITSVIGASYTSVSFLAGFSRRLEERRNLLTVGFIIFSTVVYLALGKAPVTLLVLAGALNGLILPVGFAVILWVAARRIDLLRGYAYPKWLLGIGAAVWLLTVYLGWNSLGGIADLL